eukprot:5221124-Prymnesium_polylepis.1
MRSADPPWRSLTLRSGAAGARRPAPKGQLQLLHLRSGRNAQWRRGWTARRLYKWPMADDVARG